MEVLSPGLLFRERVVGFSASQFRSCVEEMNSLAKEFKVLLPGVERYFNKDMALFRIEDLVQRDEVRVHIYAESSGEVIS